MPSLSEDTRIDPRIRHVQGGALDFMALMGDEPSFTSRKELMKYRMAKFPELMKKMASAPPPVPPPPEVKALWSKQDLTIERKTIKSSPDGNDVLIGIVKPPSTEPLPLVVYFHGGGMAVGSAFDPMYIVWARVIARQGVAVAMVDFRNCEVPSMTNQEIKPFPAGLNDCYSGLVWCQQNAAELNIDPKRICIAGESGGGNLTIATALKCKREGRLDLIPSGFFALCPYIAGAWPQTAEEKTRYPAEVTDILGDSHITNNGLFLSMRGDTNSAMGYGIEAFESRNPLAWPGMATVQDLQGLPRCVISVNECDPLRDEGVNFYRRLLEAGVQARCRDVLGTPHGGDLMATAVPDISLDAARAIADFAFGDTAHARRPLPAARL